MHLISQGYVVQAYSCLRSICESLNIIKLFALEPKLADDWALGKL